MAMRDIPDDQIQEFREAFSEFDKKGDGKVEGSQIGNVLRAFGLNPNTATIDRIRAEIDPKESKRITFEEFLPLYSTVADKEPKTTLDAFLEAFRIFDKDSNGLINAGEIRHLLTNLGEKMTDREVEKLLHGHEDSMGKVHYEGFIKSIINA